jgi:hypothetical protein
MTRNLRIFCVAAAVLAVSGATASAQPVAQSARMKADMSSFKGTNDTLINTITNVQQVTGGRVLEIRFTNKGGMPGFHTVVAKGKTIVYFHVAADGSNAVEISGSEKPDWMLKSPAKAQLQAAQLATVPLTDAIRTAEGKGGPAVAAGIATSASNTSAGVKAYNVLLLQDGQVNRVAVDDASGMIISDPSALSSWP